MFFQFKQTVLIGVAQVQHAAAVAWKQVRIAQVRLPAFEHRKPHLHAELRRARRWVGGAHLIVLPELAGAINHEATRLRQAHVAIAAARGLRQRFQACHRTVHNGKINIHTGFNQLRGDQQAGLAVRKPRADLRQHLRTVRRAHGRGKVQACGAEQLCHLAGIVTAMCDDQRGRLPSRILSQQHGIERYIQVAQDLQPEAMAHRLKVPRRLGNDLLHGRPERSGQDAWLHAFYVAGQKRLRCRAMHDTHAEVVHQPLQRDMDGLQQGRGKGLHLIQQNHTVRHAMQLAAGPLVRRMQTLQQLHAGGDDHGSIPVFAGLTIAVRIPRGAQVGVMFHHVFVAQHIAIHLRRLLQDRGVRRHHNHPPHAVMHRMVQREGKAAQGLAPTGGHGQRERLLTERRGLYAGFVDLLPHVAKITFRLGPSGEMGLFRLALTEGMETIAQDGQGVPTLRSACALIPCLGIEKVGVHKRRKQHTHRHCRGPAMQRRGGLLQRGWQPTLPCHAKQLRPSSSDGLL